MCIKGWKCTCEFVNEKQEKSNFNLILASLMKNEIYPFKN